MHARLIMASGKDNIFNMWPTVAGPAGQGTGGWADSLGWSMQLSHSGSPQPPNHEEKPRLEAGDQHIWLLLEGSLQTDRGDD